MKDEFNYYKFKQLEAISNILLPTDSYFFRKVCRWYSKTFSTKLNEVYDMDWDYILTHYYESSLEEISYNNLIDIVKDEFVPELKEQEDKEADEFAKSLEEEQAQTLINKKIKAPEIKPINLKFDD